MKVKPSFSHRRKSLLSTLSPVLESDLKSADIPPGNFFSLECFETMQFLKIKIWVKIFFFVVTLEIFEESVALVERYILYSYMEHSVFI